MKRVRISVLALLVACTAKDQSFDAHGGGTIVIAASAKPGGLFPPLMSGAVARQIDEQVYDYLLVVGPDLNTLDYATFRPRLAQSWQWSPDSLSIAFRINPAARWHDGARVDAQDVRFSFLTYTNSDLASPTAEELRNVDSVTVRDSMTAVFWYHARSSHQLLDASQPMIIPRHIFEKIPADSLDHFSAAITPIGTGRFRLKSANSSAVEAVADTDNYRGRPGVDRIIWSIGSGSAASVMKLLGGEADVFGALRPDKIPEVAKHPKLRLVSMPGTEYTFIEFNLHRPLFASREFRRAITMAIDRPAVVKGVFDTLASPAVGPTVRVFPTTDASALKEIPFDSARAGAILDSLGWKRDAKTGMRRNGTRELAFSTFVPVGSESRTKMATIIQEMLRRAGIRMNVEPIEYATFEARTSSRDFDAAFANSILGATPNSVLERWGVAAARNKKGRNSASYENPRFDTDVDSALAARSLAESRRYFTRAYQTIIDDAPAVWVSDQRTLIGLHGRIRTSTMRADSWWYDLADWTIPKSEQIARDRVPSAH